MEDFNSKLHSATPKIQSKYKESIKAPSIAINIRKRRLKPYENTSNPLYLNSPPGFFNQIYSTPKKIIKRVKRAQERIPENPIRDSSVLSRVLKEIPKSGDNDLNNFSISPKNQKQLSPGNLSLIKLEIFDSEDPKIETRLTPFVNFPVTFKAKAARKTSKSVSSTLAFEKLLIPVIEPGRLESLIKSAKTPDVKVPKYIRHESYKAGFFLSKISKVIGRIRVDRSKSSLNKYSDARNNLKFMIY